MAKLSRIVARVFGSGAGVDQIAQFGSLFAGAPAFTTDPATAQSLSNWLTGWFAAAIGGNSPAIEDMNAIFYVLSYQVAYLMQSGVPEWNTDTIYFIGSFASDGAGGIYVSLTDTNQANALSDTTKWRRVAGDPVVAVKTANYTVQPGDTYLVGNANAGAFQFTLPSSVACPGKVLYFKKTDATSNAITIARAGSDVIDGANSLDLTVPYESTVLISDGLGSWSIF